MIALLIKATLVLIVLLAFYKLFLEKESFFAANRCYLLCCLLLTATLPFIVLPELVEHQGFLTTLLNPAQSNESSSHIKVVTRPAEKLNGYEEKNVSDIMAPAPENAAGSLGRSSSSALSNTSAAPSTPMDELPPPGVATKKGIAYYLMFLYSLGMVFFSIKLLVMIVQILWKIYSNEDKIADGGAVLVNMNGNIDPCSFFHYIFINPAAYDYQTYEQIIAHEKIHARQYHTIDLLLAEIAIIVFWFNPFVWMLRKEVEKNIEFQTDDLMVRANAAARESYQLNLVKIATYTEPLAITTNYNQSLIKKRILKINTERSNPSHYLKYTFLAPLVFGLLLFLNEPARGFQSTASLPIAESPTDQFKSSALNANQFRSANDTLILKMKKHRGYGMFSGGFWPFHLEPIAENDDRRKLIPAGITDPEFGDEYIDLKVRQYQSLKKDKHEYLGEFLERWYPQKIDTANLPTEADNSVKVLVGKKDGEKVYIVDQNNNLDFRDDPVRLLQKINWTAMEEPVQCRYRIYNGKELVRDSSWVYIGLVSDDRVGVSAAQHLRSTFSLDDQDYTVRVFNNAPSGRWCFEDPQISITAENGAKKDSLNFSDKFELGEFLKFGKSYYQFADISNDGSTVTLIREADISDNFSPQAGLTAPDFRAVTMDGDSIALSDFRGRYLLLANTDMCFSPKSTYEYYKELWDSYHSKLAIVGIDYISTDMQAGIDRFKLEGKFIMSRDNPSIEQYYRDFHGSMVCFLIDPDGQVIDRFEIADWQESLEKHFN